MGNRTAVVTSVGFVMLLICILIFCIITPDKERSDNENRQLQQRPKIEGLSIASGDYMKKFEIYVSDNIIARDEWVRIKNITDFTFGKKDNGKVYFGREGYLFPIDKIDEKQLQKNLDYVKKFIENVKSVNKDINFSIIIAPTSTEILKEKMPKYAVVPNQSEILNKAEQYYGKILVNPSFTLMEHKDEYIYYKTDHHWTTLGAYYTYKIWAEQNKLEPLDKYDFETTIISDDFFGTTYSKAVGLRDEADYIERFSNGLIDNIGMKIENLDEVRNMDSIYDEKFLDTKDKYSYFLSGNNPMTIIDGSGENGHNILVIKDSYANCFVPFITTHFEKIYVVDLRYYKESLLEFTRKKEITDVMILYNAIQYSNDRNLVYLLKE